MKLPPITPRQTIENKFSQFLFFEEKNLKETKDSSIYRCIARWITNSRLQRNLRSPKIKEYIGDEFALGRYFLKILKNESLSSDLRRIAGQHIAAYLQEICYWSAKEIYENIKNLPGDNSYDEDDCWNEVNLYINEPDEELLEKSQEQQETEKLFKGLKFLKSYDLKLMVSLKSFTSYAQKKITKRVEDKISTKLDSDICTDWGLLRKITKTAFKKALKKAGIDNLKTREYSLVLEVYKEIYKSNDKKGGRPLEEPTEEHYQAMLDLYNKRLSDLKQNNLEIKSEPFKTWQKFQEMLKVCIDIARSYDNPPKTKSLSELEQKVGSDDEFEISDSDGQELDLDDDEINEWEQVNQCLSEAFDTLSLEHKNLLSLLYGFSFDQTDTAVILFGNFKKQDKVSKQNKTCFIVLLKSLAEALKFNFTNEILKQSKKSLEICLTKYCQSQIYLVLNQAVTLLNQEALHIFHNYARIIRKDSKSKLTQEEENVKTQFNSIKQSLIQPLKDYLKNELKISISANNQEIIETRLNLVIEEWLKSDDFVILLTQ